MNKKLALLFPGQGAQYPGMGKDFFDSFSSAKDTFKEADDRLNQNFSRLIFEGPAEELTLTKNSQLALFIVSIAILRSIGQQIGPIVPVACGGLSLGEYTALTAAGKIDFGSCLDLVRVRAQWMQEACQMNPGSMQVVLGLEADQVEKTIGTLHGSHPIWVANINCPGQVVIAGTESGLKIAADALKEQGAKRLLPLEVSGAFHSGLMLPAQEKLAPYIQSAPFTTSSIDVVMNTPGGFVSSTDEMRRYLFEQVVQPVRWEKCVRAMEARGIEAYIEIGAGKTLTGMNKRIGVTSPSLNIEKVADLDALHQFITR